MFWELIGLSRAGLAVEVSIFLIEFNGVSFSIAGHCYCMATGDFRQCIDRIFAN